ncbi:GGDEF domain-containing protein [Maridesulfovibrio sp.]|uniref:GGDEF domain-containing protein n=2 Tax=Maridesulfovibrio sp. TaxID=2795000 RepID=UPI002AA81B72|nr:GGDEF domain-containing protein [Maridesulfovibrio sp.]
MIKRNFRGEFLDTELEESFQHDKWPSVRFRLLFLYIVTISTYLLGACSDFYDLGPGSEFYTILIGRIGACMIGILAFVVLFANRVRLSVQYTLMSVGMFSFLLVESLELVVKASAVGTLSVPTTVFIVLAYYILLPPRLVPSLVAAVSGSVLYLGALSTLVPVQSGTFVNSAIYLFLANGFGLFFLFTFGISLRREYAAIKDLKRLVEFDELTGVSSRRKVLESGVGLFRSARRFNSKLAVLIMDIDHFKKINDDYGHHAGDDVLRETAKRCSAVLRDVDSFGRLGGEEFVIILPHSSLYDGIKVAERLRGAIRARMFQVEDYYLSSSVSIGVAELRDHGDFAELLQDADRQLYRAKNSGRNQVSPAMLRAVKPIKPIDISQEGGRV